MSNTPKSLSLGILSRELPNGIGTGVMALNDHVIFSDYSEKHLPMFLVAVIERSNGSVVEQKKYGKDINDHITKDMQPYIDQEGKFIVVFETVNMTVRHFPTGELYKFLLDCGADKGLRTLETLAGNAASQLYLNMRYIMVGIIDKTPATIAVEAYQTATDYGELVKSLTLRSVKVGDNYIYIIEDSII